jgi:hypothetical protein
MVDTNRLDDISYQMNMLIKQGKHKDKKGNKTAEYLALEFEFERVNRGM